MNYKLYCEIVAQIMAALQQQTDLCVEKITFEMVDRMKIKVSYKGCKVFVFDICGFSEEDIYGKTEEWTTFVNNLVAYTQKNAKKCYRKRHDCSSSSSSSDSSSCSDSSSSSSSCDCKCDSSSDSSSDVCECDHNEG